jgi:hypothetical protein
MCSCCACCLPAALSLKMQNVFKLPTCPRVKLDATGSPEPQKTRAGNAEDGWCSFEVKPGLGLGMSGNAALHDLVRVQMHFPPINYPHHWSQVSCLLCAYGCKLRSVCRLSCHCRRPARLDRPGMQCRRCLALNPALTNSCACHCACLRARPADEACPEQERGQTAGVQRPAVCAGQQADGRTAGCLCRQPAEGGCRVLCTSSVECLCPTHERR